MPVRTETKQAAQDELMCGMQTAISRMEFEGNTELKKAMITQFRRIEKFLGYEPGSWNEGV